MFPDGCVEERFVRWVVKEPVTGISIVAVFLCHLVTPKEANKGSLFDSLAEVAEMYVRAKGIRARQWLPWGLIVPEAWGVMMSLRDRIASSGSPETLSLQSCTPYVIFALREPRRQWR